MSTCVDTLQYQIVPVSPAGTGEIELLVGGASLNWCVGPRARLDQVRYSQSITEQHNSEK